MGTFWRKVELFSVVGGTGECVGERCSGVGGCSGELSVLSGGDHFCELVLGV